MVACRWRDVVAQTEETETIDVADIELDGIAATRQRLPIAGGLLRSDAVVDVEQ